MTIDLVCIQENCHVVYQPFDEGQVMNTCLISVLVQEVIHHLWDFLNLNYIVGYKNASVDVWLYLLLCLKAHSFQRWRLVTPVLHCHVFRGRVDNVSTYSRLINMTKQIDSTKDYNIIIICNIVLSALSQNVMNNWIFCIACDACHTRRRSTRKINKNH